MTAHRYVLSKALSNLSLETDSSTQGICSTLFKWIKLICSICWCNPRFLRHVCGQLQHTHKSLYPAVDPQRKTWLFKVWSAFWSIPSHYSRFSKQVFIIFVTCTAMILHQEQLSTYTFLTVKRIVKKNCISQCMICYNGVVHWWTIPKSLQKSY